jgi:hypothetical protein
VGVTYAAASSASISPSQPSGKFKPSALGSDSSESSVSTETSESRMSQDMSRPLSGTPDGTTNNAHVAKACVPARQRLNKAPISISGDGNDGLSFHTLTLTEERCVRLLVKNLGRGKPESVVREDLELLNIRVQGVTQLRSGRRDQDPAKDRLPTPHFII